MKSFELFNSDFVSEVGVSTGEGLEGDLFVLLQKNVVSTERPVRDKVSITVGLNLGEAREILKISICCILLLALQMCETDSQNTQLIIGLQ